MQVHSLDEVEAFTSISSALLVNMGTLSPEWVASKKLAAKRVRGRRAAARTGAPEGGSEHEQKLYACHTYTH